MTIGYDVAGRIVVRDASAGRFASRSTLPSRHMSSQGAVEEVSARLARAWNLSQLEGERPSLYRGTGRLSLKIVDLFCGCGGLSMGVKQAVEAVGARPVFAMAADLCRPALAVYARNLG